MSPSRSRALDAALALIAAPQLAKDMRGRGLPGEVRLLLEVLAGEAGALQRVQTMAPYKAAPLLAAVEFYVKEVMLFPGAPPARVLGFNGAAPRAEMRSHMRLLMLWLHPDRRHAPWQEFYAARVLEAWQSVQHAPIPQPAVRAVDLRSLPRRPRPQRAPSWVGYGPMPPARTKRRWRSVLLIAAAFFGALGLDYALDLTGQSRPAIDEALSDIAQFAPVDFALRLLRDE